MRLLKLVPLSLVAAITAMGQTPPCTVTAIAGPSTLFSGEGGPATGAYFNGITGIRFDTSGNLFIADTENQRIRKVTPEGVVSTIAGTGVPGFSGDGGAATSAQLSYPVQVSPDNHGNLYIADGDNRIRKIDANGIITTFPGNGVPNFAGDGGPATSAELQSPSDVLADGKGNVFIADSYNFRVRKVDAQGVISTIAGSGVDQPVEIYQNASPPQQLGGPAVAYSLESPISLAMDSAGNLYIGDTGLYTVFEVDGNGIITAFAGDGSYLSTYTGQPATSTDIDPTSMAFDSSGNLVIASNSWLPERLRMGTLAMAALRPVRDSWTRYPSH